MTDVGPTEPLPSTSRSTPPATGPTVGTARAGATAADDLRVERTDGADRNDERSKGGTPDLDAVVAKAARPDNRAKLLLATLALTLLNTLLLIAVLANVAGGSYESVTVDGRACVVEVAGDDSVLYCEP